MHVGSLLAPPGQALAGKGAAAVQGAQARIPQGGRRPAAQHFAIMFKAAHKAHISQYMSLNQVT